MNKKAETRCNPDENVRIAHIYSDEKGGVEAFLQQKKKPDEYLTKIIPSYTNIKDYLIKTSADTVFIYPEGISVSLYILKRTARKIYKNLEIPVEFLALEKEAAYHSFWSADED